MVPFQFGLELSLHFLIKNICIYSDLGVTQKNRRKLKSWKVESWEKSKMDDEKKILQVNQTTGCSDVDDIVMLVTFFIGDFLMY